MDYSSFLGSGGGGGYGGTTGGGGTAGGGDSKAAFGSINFGANSKVGGTSTSEATGAVGSVNWLMYLTIAGLALSLIMFFRTR